MPYGHYDGPLKPNKGLEGGACNRQSCQDEPALWYNHGSHSWYCRLCSIDIGQDAFNLKHWKLDFPNINYPMFETREMITARGGTI